MADGVSVEIQGMKELEKTMMRMGQDMALKSMRSALVGGAQVIKEEAKRRVPVKTGTLFRALFTKKLTKPNPFQERVIVGARSGKKMQKRGLDAFYWRFIEFGHKDKAGKEVSARPFIVPAFEIKKMEALNRIKAILQAKIKKFTTTKIIRTAR